MTVPPPAASRSHRRSPAALLVLFGAAASAGSAFLPWWRRSYHDPLSGDLTVAVDGNEVAVALVPLALVALAGLAAAMLSRGIARRLLGAVVALGSVGAAVGAVLGVARAPAAEFAAKLVRPATPLAAPAISWGAVALAVTAAVAAAAGGVVIASSARAAAGNRGRISGGAYRTPAAQHDAARQAARRHDREGSAGQSAPAHESADPGEWWRALDAGVDPTENDGRA